MSSLPFIPYALPEISEEEIAEVSDTLRSGWVTTGPKTREFEENFAYFIGEGVYAIAVNSATAGLHLALEAIGVTKGDEVITTTLTFTATAEVVRYMGADVKLVDVDPVTLNIDIEKVRAAITPKTKAIIPVHYGGLSCDMDKLIALAAEFNLKIIEDAAHALPSYYQGKLIGTLDTEATVFSFYANKTMTTGEGGMVVTKNKDIADRIKVMRLHGISRDAFDRFQSKKPAWYYEVVAPGYKYNLTDIASALGVQQLKKLPGFHKRRQFLAQKYLDALKNLPIILPATGDNDDVHAWHLFVIRLKPELQLERDDVINKLSENGIGTSVHYIPLHRQPYWKQYYRLENKDFPEADKAYLSMLSLPLYTAMTDEQQEYIISVVKGLLGG